MKKIFSRWYNVVSIAVIFIIALTFLICGENSVIAIKNNLELTIPQYKMLKDGGLFFEQKAQAPILGYISRYYLPSEVSLLSFIYMILPVFWAYVFSFILKILLAVFSCVYLAKTVLKEKYGEKEEMVVLLALSFGIFNVLPALSFSVAAVPLVLALIIKIYETKRVRYFIFLFLTALVGSLAYTGIFFLIGILVVFFLQLIKKKAFKPQLLIAFFVELISYVLTEYRSFILLVTRKNVTLPFFIGDLNYLDNPFILIGIILNPFVVGVIIFLCLNRLPKIVQSIACMLVLLAVLTVNSEHNDFIKTLGNKLGIVPFDGYETYKEFYEEDLFNEALKDIDYCGQISAAYGYLPATLSYNGIVAADGYIGSYYESYNYDFNKTIKSYLDSNNVRSLKYRLYFPVTDDNLKIHADDFKYLDIRLLFSDRELANAKDAGFTLIGSYESNLTDKKLYVYQTTSRYVTKEHSNIPFEERDITDYNYDSVLSMCDELTSIANEANDYKESHKKLTDEEIAKELGKEEHILSLYDEIELEITRMEDAYTLAQIRYNQDISDDTYSDMQNEIYEDYLDVNDRFYASLRDLAGSPYEVTLKEMLDPSIVDGLKEYEDMTDEQKENNVKQESLKNEYYQAAAENFYYEFQGEEWDMERLNSSYEDLEREEILEIYNGIYENRAEVLGEIYLELVELRNEEAKLEDCDNYAELMYKSAYVRDYSVEDVKKLCKELKKRGSRYLADISDTAAGTDIDYADFYVEDHRETYEQMLPYMKEIDSELGVSLEYMLRNNLFDMDYSHLKPDTGYTVPMDLYGDAFIFDSPYMNYHDLYTCVHEFGHYNRIFNMSENMFEQKSNMDISEIHSQGLEMLFSTYYKDIYGDELGSFLEINEVGAIADSVMSGAINAEFEIYVYEHPDATIKELGRQYKKIYEGYGYNINGDNSTYYGFVDIQHLFTQPCYYISYTTSALSSLEIYTLSHEDRHAAIEKYMAITAYPSLYSYSGAMQYAGLSNIFEDGVSTKILKETSKYLDDME